MGEVRSLAGLYSAPVIRKLLLGLALAWAGYAALREVNVAVTGYDLRDRSSRAPLEWRFGMPAVEDLERFAAAARPLLPAGAVVALASPESGPGDALLRYRWAAYLLPEVELVPAGSPAAGRARFALGFRRSCRPTVSRPSHSCRAAGRTR
jgi:hypothetical protein